MEPVAWLISRGDFEYISFVKRFTLDWELVAFDSLLLSSLTPPTLSLYVGAAGTQNHPHRAGHLVILCKPQQNQDSSCPASPNVDC